LTCINPAARWRSKLDAVSFKEQLMKRNVGKIDRIGRIVLGLLLLTPLVLLSGNARWIGLIGLIPLATSWLQWCPLYTVAGISTCKTENRS
jgi:hypothetical protein